MSEQVPKILVVEDEALVLHTLELILKQHGYNTRGARNGFDGISIAEAFRPDILLCDINLPDIDGIHVAIEIKESLSQVRVVLLSGEISSSELLDEARRQGYQFEVLAKPVEPWRLLAALERKNDAASRDTVGIHRVK